MGMLLVMFTSAISILRFVLINIWYFSLLNQRLSQLGRTLLNMQRTCLSSCRTIQNAKNVVFVPIPTVMFRCSDVLLMLKESCAWKPELEQ